MKSYFMGTHQKCLAKALLAKALLMSTHNICLCGEIRKISQYQPLSGAITIELVQKLYIYMLLVQPNLTHLSIWKPDSEIS